MIKFSVIVPIYNISSYIDQCVKSIINQSYKDLEIILVNDGSTDDSLKKLRMWEMIDKRIIVINKQNGGLSDARNAGLEIASGDYIGFVDGDDWIATDLYEKVSLELSKYPVLDIVTYSIKKIFPSGKEIVLSYNMSDNPVKGDDFFKNSIFYVNAWSKIYRKEFIKNRRFVKGMLHEDIPFTIPAINDASYVANLEHTFYFYRQDREGSILNTYSDKKLQDWMLGMSLLFKYSIPKNNMYLNKWILKRVILGSEKAKQFRDFWNIYETLHIQSSISQICLSNKWNCGIGFWLCTIIPKLYICSFYIYKKLKSMTTR